MGNSPVYFESPEDWRAWLERNHATVSELLVGYYRVGSGRASMTWPQSVAEALCFGWIDGVRRTVDAERYCIRFTPRRKGSVWSAINIRLVAELEASGRMRDAGRAVFEARQHTTGPKAKGYSTSKHKGTLDAACVKAFRKNPRGWEFFERQPPGYRAKVAWWVMQAKRVETRDRRMAKLIAACAQGRRLA